VNDTKNPVHKIAFFKASSPQSKVTFKGYLDKAAYCHELVSVLIRQADQHDVEKEKESASDSPVMQEQQNGSSLSEELSKLQKLKDDGVITEEEFSVAKKKLLS
jgi:hypothetical protein